MEGLKDELIDKLVFFSNHRLTMEKSQKLAEIIFPKLDLSNQYLMHKGINWLAKDILSKVDVDLI